MDFISVLKELEAWQIDFFTSPHVKYAYARNELTASDLRVVTHEESKSFENTSFYNK